MTHPTFDHERLDVYRLAIESDWEICDSRGECEYEYEYRDAEYEYEEDRTYTPTHSHTRIRTRQILR